MRRFAAIWFLFFLLFNLFGYRLVIDCLQIGQVPSSTAEAPARETELISIKVAALLPPYTSGSQNFEWVHGAITIKGITYNYVKRRILNDSIEYLCVADSAKMRYQAAKDEFFKLCHDLTNSTAQKTSKVSPVKPVFFEYWSPWETVSLSKVNQQHGKYPERDVLLLKKEIIFLLDHPPRFMEV